MILGLGEEFDLSSMILCLDSLEVPLEAVLTLGGDMSVRTALAIQELSGLG